MTDLMFRRQFVMGPKAPDDLQHWDHYPVNDHFTVSAHPDLPCTRADEGGRALILLGFVLDPRHPERDDQSILEDVLRTSRTSGETLARFDPMAGRWAVIYLADGRVRVFHDAVGFRQVYHGCDQEGALWCGSSPVLLSRVTGAVEDVEHREAMARDGLYDHSKSHFWPGSGSSFLGINRLLPNTWLDAETGEVQRFWPQSPLPTMAPDAAVAHCATLLTGVLSAAAARYPLAFALTAGHDSRALLAASRDLIDDLNFYTLRLPGMKGRHADIRVPRRILHDLGLAHKVIPVSATPSGPVVAAISAMFLPHHQSTTNKAAALFADPPRPDGTWVTVNGNLSEIARCNCPAEPVTPEGLARYAGMGASAYAVAQFDAWLTGARPALESTGINPWELFYWEQRMSSRIATVRTHFDVVEEGVTPYNSRALLEVMLGVDEALRREPESTFTCNLVEHMWPQLLDYPINPPDRVARLRRRSRSAIRNVVRTASMQRI